MKRLLILSGLGCLFVVSLTLFVTAQTATYQYNTANQLLQVRHAECTVISYAYDASGNRTERIVQSCLELSGYVLPPEHFDLAGVALHGLPGSTWLRRGTGKFS